MAEKKDQWDRNRIYKYRHYVSDNSPKRIQRYSLLVACRHGVCQTANGDIYRRICHSAADICNTAPYHLPEIRYIQIQESKTVKQCQNRCTEQNIRPIASPSGMCRFCDCTEHWIIHRIPDSRQQHDHGYHRRCKSYDIGIINSYIRADQCPGELRACLSKTIRCLSKK